MTSLTPPEALAAERLKNAAACLASGLPAEFVSVAAAAVVVHEAGHALASDELAEADPDETEAAGRIAAASKPKPKAKAESDPKPTTEGRETQ